MTRQMYLLNNIEKEAQKDFDNFLKSKNTAYLKNAQKAIDKAIGIVKKITGRVKKNRGDSLTLIIEAIKSNIELYGLAGQIYSYIDNDKSLEYFKRFQYHTLKGLINASGGYNDMRDVGVIAYKFRQYSQYLLKDLKNNVITLSRPCCMNDPFDSLYSIWSQPENLKFCVDDQNHISMFHKSFDYYRLCSFCIDDDAENNILKNILMWSHYADGHKGVCIQYRLKNDCVSTNLSPDFRHQVVLQRINEQINDTVSVRNASIPLKFLFAHKFSGWQYEKESRLICYDDTTENDRITIGYGEGISIEAVYFGLNCTDESKSVIKKLLSNQNIKYYIMKCDYNNVYKMKYEEIF